MEKANAQMSLGEEIFKEIPQLEVVVTDDKDSMKYYLTPFRAYGFQVSGTDDGQGSYGQSEFIGLQYIVRRNEKRIAIAIFRAMTLNALMDHNRHYEKQWYPNFEENQVLDKFINSSYDWVKAIVDKEDIKVSKSIFEQLAPEPMETKEPGIMDNIKQQTNKLKQQSDKVMNKIKTWKKEQA